MNKVVFNSFMREIYPPIIFVLVIAAYTIYLQVALKGDFSSAVHSVDQLDSILSALHYFNPNKIMGIL